MALHKLGPPYTYIPQTLPSFTLLFTIGWNHLFKEYFHFYPAEITQDICFIFIYTSGPETPKGQTNSKWFFKADVSSKKRMNKFNFTTCQLVFVRFLEESEDTKKTILKLTDLSEVNIASIPFSVMGVAGHLGCECFSHLSLIPKYIERIYWGLKRHYAFYAEKVFNFVNVWLVALLHIESAKKGLVSRMC